MEWQPIETAPKDGTEVVLWTALMGEPVFHCAWIKGQWKTWDMKSSHPWGGQMGWISLGPHENPTHWLKITDPGAPAQKPIPPLEYEYPFGFPWNPNHLAPAKGE